MGQPWSEDNSLLFMKCFVGQQADLEQYSKVCWQPMKETKQWNIASKRRWLCCNAGQLMLNLLKFGEVSVRDTIQNGPSGHVPLLFGTTFHYLSVQPPRLPPSEDVSKHTFLTCLPLVDSGVPNGLLMLRNSLNDFVFEHWSGYPGDIGAIEIWLIDWLKRELQ